MREIISPLDGIRSPFGVARTGGGPTPAVELAWGAGNYLVWGAGNYLVWG